MRTGFSLLVLIATLTAETFVVVTHRSTPVSSLNQSQIKMIYLKQRRYWNDLKLIPINLPPENEMRINFEKNLLKMTHSAIEDYWIKAHYKGVRPPYRVESVQSVVMFVRKVKGALGYIPSSRVEKELKVLYREGGK